ncbi:VID27-like protein [Eutrema salsugineum]|uniref:VID27-like protein n=1 Tax=Eutrema salsugineum TaxID=72664 RepID=UPI000CED2B70|nr:VID27-like protein [Eutrema salsugineum]
MDAQFLRISARMDGFDTRLCSIEQYVKETRREREGPGDEGGEVFQNDVEHEHEQGGEKLESVVTTEKVRKQKQPKKKQPKQKPKKKQKEPEQKEAEHKEAEQKEAEQKEPEMNEAELKEAKQKEAEQLVSRSPYLLRSKEVEPNGDDAVNAEVGAGKQKQEQSKLGPNTKRGR